MLLTGGCDAQANKHVSAVWHRHTSAEVVANRLAVKALMIEGLEVTVNGHWTTPNKKTAPKHGLEGDGISIRHQLIVEFGVIDDAVAVFGDLGNQEEVDASKNILDLYGFNDTSLKELDGVRGIDESNRNGTSGNNGKVLLIEFRG